MGSELPTSVICRELSIIGRGVLGNEGGATSHSLHFPCSHTLHSPYVIQVPATQAIILFSLFLLLSAFYDFKCFLFLLVGILLPTLSYPAASWPVDSTSPHPPRFHIRWLREIWGRDYRKAFARIVMQSQGREVAYPRATPRAGGGGGGSMGATG